MPAPLSIKKIYSVLSMLGLCFLIALGIQFAQSFKNRGEVITTKVEVPQSFEKQFSRVITKNRTEAPADVSFIDPDGTVKKWEDFSGDYLLVNFWATWCPPCVVELPALDALRQAFEDKGLTVIAISMDRQKTHADIQEFLEFRGISFFAAYWDNARQIDRSIPMRGIPTTYLLDRQGNILHIFEGDAKWDGQDAKEFFSNLLMTAQQES